MKQKWQSFWNDDDGFSAKDFLMVLFCVLFALFLVTAFIISLLTGTLPAATVTVIGMMDIVIPTILAGVFGVQVVKEIKKKPEVAQPSESVEGTSNGTPRDGSNLP